MAKGSEYGFVVKLGVDDSDAVDVLKDMDKELAKAETAYKNIEKAIQKVEAAGGDTTGLMVQKQEQLNNILVITSERYMQLEQLQNSVNQAIESSPDWTTADTTNYITALAEAKENVTQLEEAVKNLANTQSGEADEEKALAETTDHLNRQIEESGRYLEAYDSKINAIKSSMGAGKASFNDYIEYNQLLQNKIEETSDYLNLLKSKEEEVEEAFRNGKIPVEQYTEFQNEIKNAADSLSQYREESISLNEALDNMHLDNLMKNLDTVSGYFDKLISNLKSLATETAKYGDTVDKQSQRLGMSEEAYQEWTYILSQNGANISTLTAGMRTLTNQIAKSGDSLKKLGLDAKEMQKLTGEEQFSAVITALQGMEDQTTRNNLANTLLGRSYQQLIPLLNQSADTVEKLRQKAHDTNQILDENGVDAAVAYTDALDTMNKSIQGFKNQLGAEVLPVLTEFITKMTDIINGMSEDDIKHISESLVDVIEQLAEGVQEFIDDGGIEKIIDSVDWLISHTDEITAVLTVLADVWVADKVVNFAEKLKIIPDLVKSVVTAAKGVPSVISALGTTFANVGTAISTAMTSAASVVGVSCAAMTAAAAGAIAAIAAAIAIADELNDIGSAMNETTSEAEKSQERVQKMQSDVSDIKNMEHSLEQYDAAIKKKEELQKANEEWAQKYKETNDEIAELEEKGYKSKEDMVRLNELKLQRDNLDVEYDMYQNQYARLENILDDYTQKEVETTRKTKEAVDKLSEDDGLSQDEKNSNAQKRSNEKQNKLIQDQEDAITNYYKWLDKEKALHHISEKEYYEQSEKWLKEHNYTESQAWWKHQDEYDNYVQKQADADEKAANQRKTAQEKALKEEEKQYKESVKSRYESLERQRDADSDDEYGDEWFVKSLESFLGTLEEGTDLYYEYYDKWLKAKNDLEKKNRKQIEDDAKDEVKTWENAADKVSDAVKKRYEDVQKSYKKANDEFVSALNVFEDESTKAADNVVPVFGRIAPTINTELDKTQKESTKKLADIKKQNEELKKYQKNINALKNTDISEEHMANIMSMSLSDREDYVEALMGMSERERNKYFAEYEEYLKTSRKLADESVAEELDEADRYAEAATKVISDAYDGLSDVAREKGKATADAFLEGISQVMNDTNKDLISGALFGSDYKHSNLQLAESAAKTYAEAAGGYSVSSGNTIKIYIDGKEAMQQVITDNNTQINLSGGMVGG